MEEDEYILGTEAAELARLRHQHEVWAEHAQALWQSAGLVEGSEVLDVGCGPGFATLALAEVVGPSGRVVGRDLSQRFLTHLSEQARVRGAHQVSASLGCAQEYDAALGRFDFVYARWLLCWLENAKLAIEVAARYLKPGGAIIIQDYLDWGGARLLPHSAAFERVIKACMDSWEQGLSTINIAAALPKIANDLGLTLSQFEPIARLGAAGSMEWNWIGAFIHSYSPRLQELDHIQGHELAAMKVDWEERERDSLGYCYTPIMANAVMIRGKNE